MSDLESLLAEAKAKLDELDAAAQALESRAREAMIDAAKARAFVEGLLAAQSVSPPPKQRSRMADNTGTRSRELSAVWKRILRRATDQRVGQPFDYADLAAAAEATGHDASRETLRSQMSLYKGRGLVESEGSGAFRLTDAGHEAIDDGKGEPPAVAKRAVSNNFDDIPF